MAFVPDAQLDILTLSQYRDYDELKAVLEFMNFSASASELQGFAAAALASPKKLSSFDWLNHCIELFSSGEQAHPLDSEDKTYLAGFFQAMAHDLGETTLSFELLLPDETCSLSDRTGEMSHWCQGFLLGVGIFFKNHLLSEKPELESLLIDIEKIAQVEIPTEEALDEEDANPLEFDLFELTEYLKIAALSFYTEFLADEPNLIKEEEEQLH